MENYPPGVHTGAGAGTTASAAPEKSVSSGAAPAGKDGKEASSSSSGVREQDRLLPIANISRIMKRALPAHAKMSKEAKTVVQECVSEFIGFVTSEASERLEGDKRKTVTGDDLMDSLRALGFDAYAGFLEPYLKRYRESAKGGRATPVKRGRKKGGDEEDADGDDEDAASTGGADDDSTTTSKPKSKKLKSTPATSSAPVAATAPATAAGAAPLPDQQQQLQQLQQQQQMMIPPMIGNLYPQI